MMKPIEPNSLNVAVHVSKKCRQYREGQLILAMRKRDWLRKQIRKATTLQERLVLQRLIRLNLDRIEHFEKLLHCGIYKTSSNEA